MRGRILAWSFSMSIADLNTLNAAYEAAIDAESWDEALKVLSKISIRLATTPNLSRSIGGGGTQSIAWTAQSVAEQQSFCIRMKAASYGATSLYQQTPVTYKRADDTGDYA